MDDDVAALKTAREDAYKRTQRAYAEIEAAYRAAQDYERRAQEAKTDDQRQAHLAQAQERHEARRRANSDFMTSTADYMKALDDLRQRGLA